MSLSLVCNNCKSPISKDNPDKDHQNNFFYKNDLGQPICKTCGPESYTTDSGWLIICFIITIFIITTLMITES